MDQENFHLHFIEINLCLVLFYLIESRYLFS